MKQISDANYSLVVRLLQNTYNYNRLKSLQQDETRRKAGLLYKKLKRAEEKQAKQP